MAEATAAAMSLPLPTELAGARIEVNGAAAPLIFASPEQINFQVPFEAPSSSQVEARVIKNSEPSLPAQAQTGQFALPCS